MSTHLCRTIIVLLLLAGLSMSATMASAQSHNCVCASCNRPCGSGHARADLSQYLVLAPEADNAAKIRVLLDEMKK